MIVIMKSAFINTDVLIRDQMKYLNHKYNVCTIFEMVQSRTIVKPV